MRWNDKSCMLDALCNVIGLHIVEAVAIVGHDGSDRGFHSQELVDVCLFAGYTLTEVQRHPRAIHPKTFEELDINFPGGNDARFIRYLASSRGVVMGSKLGSPHAVAWDGLVATDPANGLHFRLLNDKRELVEEFYKPITLLKVNRND